MMIKIAINIIVELLQKFYKQTRKSIDHVDKSIQSYLRRISGDGDQHDVIRAFSSRKSNISKEKTN